MVMTMCPFRDGGSGHRQATSGSTTTPAEIRGHACPREHRTAGATCSVAIRPPQGFATNCIRRSPWPSLLCSPRRPRAAPSLDTTRYTIAMSDVTETLTIHLPVAAAQRLRRVAEISRRAVDDMIADTLDASLPPLLEDVPTAFQAD